MRNNGDIADEARSVAAVYEDGAIAASYLDKRTKLAWQRLLHDKQVAAVNAAIAKHAPRSVLEVAPGPARLTAEITGVQSGVLVENSVEMIAIARKRLAERGLDQIWSIHQGNAFALSEALPAERFDLAFTFRFIRHFREQERALLYSSLREKLNEGGVLVFDVVNRETRDVIDAQNDKPAGEIAIYDAVYTKASFSEEMRAAGFEVLEMTPIISRFALQSWLSYKLEDVVPGIVSWLVNALESSSAANPLEWVAVCKRTES